MNNHLPDIRTSIDDYFADMDTRPSLQYKVLAQARGEVKVKKKASVGLVLVVVLILATAGAVAAVLLSMQQLVEEQAIPMANQYEDERYTVEDTNILVQLAEQNGIVLSEQTKDQIQRTLDQGEGYFKEEMLMAMAKAEFGEFPSTWTLEQQKWFDDVCVAIGIIPEAEKAMPVGGENEKQRVIQAANDYIRHTYEADAPLNDPAKYRVGAQYLTGDADDQYGGMYWSIDYSPLYLEGAEYWVYLSNDCTVLDAVVRPGLSSASTVSDIMDSYNRVFGSELTWNQHTLRAFQEAAMHATDTSSRAYLCLAQTSYPDIPTDAISKDRAHTLAVASVGFDAKLANSQILLIGDNPNPVWKVLVVQDASQWYVEIDCITGEIKTIEERDEFHRKWWMRLVLCEISNEVDANWVDHTPSVG